MNDETRLHYWEHRVENFRIVGDKGLVGSFPKSELGDGATMAERARDLQRRVSGFKLTPNVAGVTVAGDMASGFAVTAETGGITSPASAGTATPALTFETITALDGGGAPATLQVVVATGWVAI